ncbi:aldehyde dehydrogenase family protein [Mycobacterium heckeshornense]|uniref:aldehyde dehydrogenase family protein n=1 Tax=Mycobacterium heckeshornense TaxID=110505 RepID=UPI00399337AE
MKQPRRAPWLRRGPTAGQTCISGSRLLVERSAHDALLGKLITYTKADVTLGNGFDPNTTMGPLIFAQQLQRVCGYIDLGKREGASLVLGGDRWGDRGCFVNPTTFTGVRNDMRIAREEIFGPVLSVIAFDTDEKAYGIGNDTDYGLGGALWTRDVERALHGAAAIRSGPAWVNTYAELQSNVGFDGVKQSGLVRELGGGIDAKTETKTVYMRHK